MANDDEVTAIVRFSSEEFIKGTLAPLLEDHWLSLIECKPISENNKELLITVKLDKAVTEDYDPIKDAAEIRRITVKTFRKIAIGAELSFSIATKDEFSEKQEIETPTIKVSLPTSSVTKDKKEKVIKKETKAEVPKKEIVVTSKLYFVVSTEEVLSGPYTTEEAAANNADKVTSWPVKGSHKLYSGLIEDYMRDHV